MSYHRDFPLHIERHSRDDAYIALLEASLTEFADRLDAMTDKAVALGAAVKPKRSSREFMGPSLAETIRRNEAAMRLHAP